MTCRGRRLYGPQGHRKVLVTSTNEEDPIKNEVATVAKTLNINFSNTQGQITPQSWVGSGQNSTHPRCYSYPRYYQQ